MRRTASIITTLFIVIICMPVAVASYEQITKYLGLRATAVGVVGTGSMYPSLFWDKSEGGPDDSSKRAVEEYRTNPHMYNRFRGFRLGSQTYLRRPIEVGDMVSFRNSATVGILEKEGKDIESGFIKRVIAAPGDTLELRDGFVYRNGEEIDEPYIFKPRSTYGDVTLADCKKMTVPDGKYFVMGDNRKTSADSRGELGLVDDQDISFVLPLSDQKLYLSHWRDTTLDAELAGSPTLDASAFLTLLNQARRDRKIPILQKNSTLTESAKLKGSKYLSGNDYSLKSALQDAGYSNILTSEFVTSGHYDAAELLQNLLYFGDTAQQVLDPKYQEIGISAVNREIDGCPSQVIVGHLGGYIPAEYDQAVVDSWLGLVDNLRTVVPSWEKAVEYKNVDQNKLTELISILKRRLVLAEEISSAMKTKKWLTPEQELRITQDTADADRANILIDELNKQ